MRLNELAREYRANAALLELRAVQLQKLLPQIGCLEEKRRVRRRINLLHTMICDSRCTANELEHYHDAKGA